MIKDHAAFVTKKSAIHFETTNINLILTILIVLKSLTLIHILKFGSQNVIRQVTSYNC